MGNVLQGGAANEPKILEFPHLHRRMTAYVDLSSPFYVNKHITYIISLLWEPVHVLHKSPSFYLLFCHG